PEGPLSLIPTRALRLCRQVALWSGPVVNTRAPLLWTSPRYVGTGRGRLVDRPEEIERGRIRWPETLVGLGSWGIELLPRTPSGESGIGRRRRSAQCLTGLPGGSCGSQVTGPAGSEETAGSTGSVTSTGHSGEPPDHGLVPGPDGSPPEGPLSLIPMRALRLWRARWRSGLDQSSTPGPASCGHLPDTCGRDRAGLWTDLR